MVHLDQAEKLNYSKDGRHNSQYQHTGIKLSTQDGLFAETPAIPYDGGLNYHFKDLGNTTEVVTYQGEKCEDAAHH